MKKSIKRIISFALMLSLLVGMMAGFGVFAAEETTEVEIVSNNVYYSDTLNLMYAVRTADENVVVNIYDEKGDLVEVIKDYAVDEEGVINGEKGLKAFISEIGVPAQEIDTVFYAQAVTSDGAKSEMERYSVLEYLYERLTTTGKKAPSAEQETMYKSLLAFADAADIVINETAADKSIGNYAYVTVTNGTVDGTYATAMVMAGTALDALTTTYTPASGKILGWSIDSYKIGEEATNTVVNDDVISKFVLEGGKVYELTASSVDAGAPPVQTVTVSKTNKDIASIAGVTVGQNTGVIADKTIKLDDNISIVCAKGTSTSDPCVYDESIRLYQNGATLTVKAEAGAKMKTIVLTLANTSGDGPIAVEGGSADDPSAPQNLVYTITVDADASQVVITTKGTDKNSRLYVSNIEVVYEK